jgi:hypothetical protein
METEIEKEREKHRQELAALEDRLLQQRLEAEEKMNQATEERRREVLSFALL